MNIRNFLGFGDEKYISAVKIPIFAWLTTFTVFIVLDDKGGVGKSFIAQVVAAIIRYFDKYDVGMIDTDYSNSSTAQIDQNTKMLNLDEKVWMGTMIKIVRDLASQKIHHAVLDAGARDERKIRKLLPGLNDLVRNAGGRIVVIRPITLGPHNQHNAATFMDIAQDLKIPTIFVCNEGQGRYPEYFDTWKSTDTLGNAFEKGAVQTSITDADVRYVDGAVGFGLSMMDVATADFSKLEFNEEMPSDADEEARNDFEQRRADAALDRTAAEELFTTDVIAFIAEWLRINIFNIGTAIEEAIKRRAQMDEGDQPADPATPSRRRRQ